MKKRILSTLAVVTMCVLMFGCGSKNESQDTTADAVNNEPGIEATQEETEKEAQSGGEITVDAVKNAVESDGADFEYEEVEGGISITDYNGMDEIIVVPEKIDGYTVVEIGEAAFANNENIKGIKFADTVKVISKNALCNCFGLQVAICGTNLERIEDYAFAKCDDLTDVELNDGLLYLGVNCFPIGGSIEEIYIPASVTELDWPFQEGENVTIITESGSAAEQYAIEFSINYVIK